MFQLAVGRILIPGLILFGFLYLVFWRKKKAPNACCKGSCKKGPANEKSEE